MMKELEILRRQRLSEYVEANRRFAESFFLQQLLQSDSHRERLRILREVVLKEKLFLLFDVTPFGTINR